VCVDVPSLTFSGDPADYRRVLALCLLAFGVDPDKYPTDIAKIAHFGGYFRGPALDWLVAQLSGPNGAVGLGDFATFRASVENAFALNGVQEQAALVARLQVMRCHRSAIFPWIAEFESVTQGAGILSDVSRVALARPMLPDDLNRAISELGTIPSTWGRLKVWLQNYAVQQPPRQAAPKAKRCSRCGKTGHRAKNCKTGN
jgi:hypothetical protein